MDFRCPNSKKITTITIPNWKLVFRGVADIIKYNNSILNLALYEITEKCERALDKYEGYPILYKKKYFKINFDGKIETILTYIMKPKYGIGPPPEEYFKIIAKGYKDWNIGPVFLLDALKFSTINDSDKFYKSSYWKNSPLINTFQFINNTNL